MELEHRAITREEIPAWQDSLSVGFLMQPDPVTNAFAEGIFDLRRSNATFEDGRIVGTYVSFDSPVTLPGGTQISSNCISGVTVAPTHRNRGILRHAITKDLSLAKDRGQATALLLASEFPIYGRFGFGVACKYSELLVDCRGIEFRKDPPPGSMSLVIAPIDEIETCIHLFASARTQTATAIDRASIIWERAFCLIPDRPDWQWKGFLAISKNSAGEPDGFVRYTPKDDWKDNRPGATLTIDEFIATTPEAHQRMWHYLTTMAWVATIKVEECAIDDDIRLLPTDERRVAETGRGDHTWSRVLDVVKVLTSRTYESVGACTFEVVDDLGFTTGRYALDASPSGSTCKRVKTKPDFTIAVSELSSVAFGGASLTAFHRTGRVDEHKTGSTSDADRLFRSTRAPWNPTRF
jgi:predicted acetyltransferase